MWVFGSFVGISACIYLLKRFSVVIVKTIAISCPLGILAFSISTLYEALYFKNYDVGLFLVALSSLGIIFGLFCVYILYLKKAELASLNAIINLSMDVLLANPGLFLLCVALSVVSVVSSVAWLWLFSRMFVHGTLIYENDFYRVAIDKQYLLGVIFIIPACFTSFSVLLGVQKVVVAAVVSILN